MKTYLKALAVVAVLAAAAASAESPNLYTCTNVEQGMGFEVSYSTSSKTGKPLFHLQESLGSLSVVPPEPLSKMGDEIRVARSPMGSLVTVRDDRSVIVDGPSYTFTLVVPHVNLSAELLTSSFDTMLIRTRHANTIGGPSFIRGPIEDSEYVPVRCEARSVRF